MMRIAASPPLRLDTICTICSRSLTAGRGSQPPYHPMPGLRHYSRGTVRQFDAPESLPVTAAGADRRRRGPPNVTAAIAGRTKSPGLGQMSPERFVMPVRHTPEERLPETAHGRRVGACRDDTRGAGRGRVGRT
ncbi:hypothetical protein FRAHR75_690041 [Frankia sp. Hr75.2]|nr:hypothetical protein FRAHR75_690041 [Frankia sp. Hr75.2]SQD99437.1 hypothetical protein FMEAI12_5290014 [Parafrankia sp. Ea1.12]